MVLLSFAPFSMLTQLVYDSNSSEPKSILPENTPRLSYRDGSIPCENQLDT